MAGLPGLDELVAIVEERRQGEEPLARVEAAAVMSYELSAAGDAVLTHFVEAARAAGLSWAQIGRALGVSKQGAQQRFAGRAMEMLAPAIIAGRTRRAPTIPVLERFTRRARNSVRAAAAEAQRLKQDDVGTEHLLLGLLAKPQNLAVRALERCGRPAEAVRAAVEGKVDAGEHLASARAELTPGAREALELSMGEALRLGHDYIGTEHTLLVLVNEEGPGGETLRGLGLTHDQIGEAVAELLADQELDTG